MPTYSFKNNQTSEIFEIYFDSYSEKQAYLNENPHIESCINYTCGFSDGQTLGRMKPDSDFAYNLRQIKKAHPGSNINEW